MKPITIIADDLTGALDTAVHFARRGLRTVVVGIEKASSFLPHREHEAVVVNTESRHIPAADAHNRMRVALEPIQSMPGAIVYKKTDSTLRGNIGAEFSALREVWPHRSVVFAPALPAQGRTTRSGIHYVGDKTVDKTEFAQDPINPIGDPRIATLLERQTSEPITLAHPDNLDALLDATPGSAPGSGIVVVDAQNDDDLARIAGICAARSDLVLPAGSAGLAGHLLDCWADPSSAYRTDGPRSLKAPRLLVSGSLNPVALAQTRDALALGLADIVFPAGIAARMSADSMPSSPRRSTDVEELVDRVAVLLDAGNDVCLRTVLDRSEVPVWQREFEKAKPTETPIHTALPAAYGALIRPILDRIPVATLVVFGGDTVHGIITRLNVESIEPICELLPGVVYSGVDISGRRLALVTKAGGFDSDTSLAEILFGDGTGNSDTGASQR